VNRLGNVAAIFPERWIAAFQANAPAALTGAAALFAPAAFPADAPAVLLAAAAFPGDASPALLADAPAAFAGRALAARLGGQPGQVWQQVWEQQEQVLPDQPQASPAPPKGRHKAKGGESSGTDQAGTLRMSS